MLLCDFDHIRLTTCVFYTCLFFLRKLTLLYLKKRTALFLFQMHLCHVDRQGSVLRRMNDAIQWTVNFYRLAKMLCNGLKSSYIQIFDNENLFNFKTSNLNFGKTNK